MGKLTRQIGLLVWVVFLGWGAEAQPLRVSPQNGAIRYVGRFTGDHRFGWTGCTIETDFQGSELSADLELVEGSAAALAVVVDGQPRFLKVSKGRKTYPVFQGPENSGKHRIALFKRSEGSMGTVRFHGFQTSEDATLSRPPARALKMLVVGDSITSGYGNEARTLAEGNTLENENGYMSYAAIAARLLDADLMMFCWSGRGMYRNYQAENDQKDTIPQIFNRTLPMSAQPEWNHSRFVPDVIVINLGTNDMSLNGGKKPLPKAGFVAAYKGLLDRLRAIAPEAKIILGIGPMAFDPVREWLPEIAAEYENTAVLVYSPFAGPADKGGHHHPSVKKDREMARELVAAIKH
jgi:lysophospholipase L1-like esterase